MSFTLPEDTRVRLDGWTKEARGLLDELLEDAGSELQREFLFRAVAAGHTPREVHAFADELRALSDEEAYEVCTLHDTGHGGYTVAQLMRAESDPLYAFELKGGELEPGDELLSAPPPTSISAPSLDPVVASLLRNKQPRFEAESRGPARPVAVFDAVSDAAPAKGGSHTAVLNDSTRALKLSWQQFELDVPGGLTLKDALAKARAALERGVPVGVGVGPQPKEHRRFVVLLQVNESGGQRSWQLFDPRLNRLYRATEADLLSGKELPFADKANRRLTRLIIPQLIRS